MILKPRTLALSVTLSALALAALWPRSQDLDLIRQRASQPRNHAGLPPAIDLAATPEAVRERLKHLPELRPPELAELVTQALAVQDVKTAVQAQLQLCRLDPTAANRQRLESLLLQSGDPAWALALLDAYPEIWQDSDWNRLGARLATWSQAPAKALSHLKALFDRAPELALGKDILARLDPAEKLDFARKLLARFPDDAGLRRDARNLMMREGRVDEALDMLQAQVAKQPGSAELHRELVDLAVGNGKLAIALSELERWVSKNPNDHQAGFELARTYAWNRQPDEAFAAYRKLLAAHPREAEARWRKAWLELGEGLEHVDPLWSANLEALAKAEPDSRELRRQLAEAKFAAGDHAGAIQALKHLAEGPKALPEDRERLARWLLWYAEPAEGLAWIRQADARTPLSPQAIEQASFLAGSAERWDDAAHFLERLVQHDPSDGARWERLAMARERADDLPGATQAWLEAAERPDGGEYQRLSAVALMKRQDRLEDAVKLLSAPSASIAELREWSSLSYLMKRPADQERALRAIIARDPQDGEAQESLGYLFESQERSAEALEVWRNLVSIAPERLSARLALGQEALRRQAPGDAAPHVEAALRLAPRAYAVRLMEAEWLKAKGDAAAAGRFAALRAENPDEPYLLAAEAGARYAHGEYGAAWRLLKDGSHRFESEDLKAMALGMRERGASRVGSFGWVEDSALMSRSALGTEVDWNAGDRLRLAAGLAQRTWSGVNAPARDLLLSGRFDEGPWSAAGKLGVTDQQGLPLAGLHLGARAQSASVRLDMESDRWEESAATVARAGRQRKVTAGATWSPWAPVTLGGSVERGMLSLADLDVGASSGWTGDLGLRAAPESPWGLRYQFRERDWGTAGPQVGLPAKLGYHSFLASLNGSGAGWQGELRPGYQWDAASGEGAPVLAGDLSLRWGLANEVGLSGIWSGRSLAQGAAGSYQRVDLSYRWWF